MAPPEPKRLTPRGRGPAAEAQALEAAWQALGQAGSLGELALPWLRVQLRQAGAEAGAVYVGDPAAGPVAALPDSPTAAMDRAAARAMASGQPVNERPDDDIGTAILAHPLQVSEASAGAVVLAVGDVTPQRLRSVTRALTWGLAWLRERLAHDRLGGGARQLQAMRAAHEAVAAAHDDHDFRPAALGCVTRLAHLVQADRVTLGLYRGGRTHIAAVSHSAEFGRRLTLSRDIAAAMDEAIEQRAALTWPAPPDEINVTRQQEELSRKHGDPAVLTLPFLVADQHRGAFTFERTAAQPFAADEIALMDAVASLVGPTLWEKRQNDKALIFKVWDTIRRQTVKLLGPGHAGRKLTVVALIAVTVLFATWTQPYRTTADARIEGAIERSLVAPFDGFIREASVRAGDRVTQGQVVAALDDRDLALERLRWMTDARQKSLELGRAIGEQNRAQAEIVRAQIAQAEAQIELIDAQLARAQIIAPFDGVIVSGDQSQNIGGAVTRGEPLFEIAPTGDYRVVLQVDEARIGEVHVGQTGEVVLTALPRTPLPFEVQKLTPVAIAEDGRNFFRVEAALSSRPDAIGPGMEGIAKVDIDERLVIQIWTRAFVDWARLTLWKWFG